MKNEIKNLSSRVCEEEKNQKFIAQSFEDNDINTMKALDDLSELKKSYWNTLLKKIFGSMKRFLTYVTDQCATIWSSMV